MIIQLLKKSKGKEASIERHATPVRRCRGTPTKSLDSPGKVDTLSRRSKRFSIRDTVNDNHSPLIEELVTPARSFSGASVDFDVSKENIDEIKLEIIEEEAEEDSETIEKVEKETSTVCNFCGKKFVSHGRLRHHIREYHEDNVVQCGICSKQFKGKKNLREHMRTHKPMVECNDCNKLFKETSICIYAYVQYAAFTLRQQFLPFFYVKSLSNFTPNGSFRICSP